MGTTLTGTTPQDTYDSLIKVTDNGPLSGTLKALSDGLGNDSTLSLSTTAASIAGTLAVAGAATFDTTTLVVDATNDRVGINKATPTTTLDVSGTFAASGSVTSSSLFIANTDGALGAINSSGANGGYFEWRTSGTTIADIGTAQQIFGSGGNDTFGINARGARSLVFGSNNAERVRITSAGVVELAQGQIKFPATQVPSADANTLDDYEEGTFTPTIAGSTTAGTATYVSQVGVYTKIGRIVNFSITINYNSGTGTGNLTISGLPFTSLAAGANSSASIGAFVNVALSASHIATASVPNNSVFIGFEQYPTGGGSSIAVPYDAAGVILISGTYEV